MTVDWDRWHDLLDIRDDQGFTFAEQREYKRFKRIVRRYEDEEVARTLGNKCIGIELNEDYIEMIRGRLAQDVLPFGERV